MYTILTVVYGFKFPRDGEQEPILEDAIDAMHPKGMQNTYNNDDDKYAYFGIVLDQIDTLEASKPSQLKLTPTAEQTIEFNKIWKKVPKKLKNAITEVDGSTLPDVWIIPSTS